jgi:hypothetical protein
VISIDSIGARPLKILRQPASKSFMLTPGFRKGTLLKSLLQKVPQPTLQILKNPNQLHSARGAVLVSVRRN